MGGKNKQAQRTKNNARPSSSGRSAELLGNNVPQFAGFGGIKETGFIMPTFSLPSTDEMELEIDTTFLLVFKKMNKKDTTTKLKALQEFAELVKNSDGEAVKAVLPFWPRLYNVFATDSEHKVREATHIAHNEVVQKVKRNLAPYLKQIIAPWFISQYDTYPPAASAASASFNAAFPEKKVEEAIAFCNQEILNYIHDNLFILTPQTVCDQKHNTREDAVAKYERVLLSSLLGYSLYLKKIQKDKIESSAELNKKIISSSKFWKYAKHNLTVIRAAWFEVLTALFQKAPFLLENEEGHVTSATLGNIDESDPVVLPLVWQNVLLAISSIKEWWTKVNIDKLMMPKLWKVLKEGGQGNAAVIYPNLLPLLSNLTPIVDENTFYSNFFQSLCLGLKQKSVISSKSESTAVSTSLIECLRFVIMKNESNTILCEKLIKSHLISTLEWCLLENQSCYKTIFNQTASLAQYWSRNNTSENPNYSRYLNYFWTNVDSLFQGVLLNLDSFESEKICNISDRQIEFLQSLKHTAKVKKTLKVKFDADDKLAGSSQSKDSLGHPDELYIKSLTNLVFKICEAYVKIIDDKKSKELLDHMVVLIQEFNSKSFFIHISKEMGSSEDDGVMAIFRNLLKNWLQCESLLCKSLIDLIFLMFEYLDDRDKNVVLESVDAISNEDCLGWCLEKALSHQHNKDPLIQRWLISDKVSELLVRIVEREIADECPSNLSALLKLAITENEMEELYVSKQAVSRILEKLKEPLLNPNEYLISIDSCASLASYLSAIVYTEKLLLTFNDELLLALVRLSCNTNIDSDYLSCDTVWEVQTAWQDAFTVLSASLPLDELERILAKIVLIIQKTLEENNIDAKN
ncbi:hypothetical protein HHI36_017834 [Cryptolaemus montrouzieri]|uniref:E3 ubiquitin-protein ligase listerin n=1 Tax=Cryptolaemus montrouzieri TaxID=559131 RepID=A0ABD2NP20_9CUCU